MSYLSELQAFYPKSWKQRIALNQYRNYKSWEGKEPITVTVHQVIQRYGGPEEGGWYWNQGFPEKTYCIFNKKQAVKTFLEVSEEYEVWDQDSLGLTSTDYIWEVNFAANTAKHYPMSTPHYC